MKTLIVYGTNYGTSEKVGKLVSEGLKGEKVLVNAKNTEEVKLSDYNRVVIGASIKMGMITKELKSFLKNNEEELKKKEIYIYICAGNGAEEKIDEALNANLPNGIIEKAREKLWAGYEYNLSKMGAFSKFILRVVAKQKESEFAINEEEIRKFILKLNK